MVRELLAQIEPHRLTASPHGKPARRRNLAWLVVGLTTMLIVAEYVFELPKVSSFVSSAVICIFVAGMAYVALAGELGDETNRWQTSSIFIVVTVGIGYALYLSRQGREPALDPSSVMIAVLLGFCVAGAYAETVKRERREKSLDAALRRIRTPAAGEFEGCLPFQSISGVVWAIDTSRRAVRAVASSAPGGDRSIVWDEPIRAVELRRAPRARWSSGVFDCDLLVRSGTDFASDWTYVFEFPGPYRETAVRWREIFEDWMIEDKRRAAV